MIGLDPEREAGASKVALTAKASFGAPFKINRIAWFYFISWDFVGFRGLQKIKLGFIRRQL